MTFRTFAFLRFFEVFKTYRLPVPDRYVTKLTSISGEVIPVELNYTKFSGTDDYAKGCIVFLTDLREKHKLREHINRLAIEKDVLKIQLEGEDPDLALLERTFFYHAEYQTRKGGRTYRTNLWKCVS